ncbi:MAG: N-formylglutamate deformylase, partial [Gammaproteobacteria bacterium]|nr:N-formylglutamate deformylase [Gammaproteobacteria bacterium]
LIPFLFEGKLADFNIGTNSGSSCDLSTESTVKSLCNCATEFDTVTNGRFKGGWTTRHYGQPQRGYHTIQMELAQCNYMLEQAPWHYDSDRAARLRVILADILTNLATVLG